MINIIYLYNLNLFNSNKGIGNNITFLKKILKKE